MRRARGSAFITVVAVLALLSILMEIALQLLVSHVSESRRRGDAAYAGELARSGLEWARACVASGSASCSRRLEIGGGIVAVETKPDGETGMLLVTARGTVLRGGAPGQSREAATRVRPPDPGSAPPSPAAPPEVAPAPEGEPEREPGDLEHHEPGDAGSVPAVPSSPDPTTALQTVPHP